MKKSLEHEVETTGRFRAEVSLPGHNYSEGRGLLKSRSEASRRKTKRPTTGGGRREDRCRQMMSFGSRKRAQEREERRPATWGILASKK